MSLALPPAAFVGLAAVVRADQRMTRDEAAALVRAARECGLTGPDLQAVENATTSTIEIANVDASGLSPWQRVVTYALGTWLARIDGVVQSAEHASLASLARTLELPKKTLDAAGACVLDVMMLPAGNRPDKYDFVALEKRLRERLPTLAEAD